MSLAEKETLYRNQAAASELILRTTADVLAKEADAFLKEVGNTTNSGIPELDLFLARVARNTQYMAQNIRRSTARRLVAFENAAEAYFAQSSLRNPGNEGIRQMNEVVKLKTLHEALEEIGGDLRKQLQRLQLEMPDHAKEKRTANAKQTLLTAIKVANESFASAAHAVGIPYAHTSVYIESVQLALELLELARGAHQGKTMTASLAQTMKALELASEASFDAMAAIYRLPMLEDKPTMPRLLSIEEGKAVLEWEMKAEQGVPAPFHDPSDESGTADQCSLTR
jgi:molybdenum-dependent DNA-binding transcriptional regulator ModE